MWSFMLILLIIAICGHQLIVVQSSNSTDVTPPNTIANVLIHKINCTLNDVRSSVAEQINVQNDYERKEYQIDFINCTLPILPSALFSTLDVINISIINSKVSIIAEGWLNDLDRLELVRVQGNRVRELQTWSQDILDHLEELDVQNNEIWRIDGKAFNQYPNLKRLHLGLNKIETLSEGIFKETPSLKWLSLAGNLIKRIESMTFKSLLKLKVLHLENNRIEYINPYALTTTSHLTELYLEDNKISTIDILFYNLPKLSYLNMSFNQLEAKALEENVFHQNENLKILDLGFNRFREFQVGAFNGLQALEILNISNNLLQYIQPFTLTPLDSVRHIDISNNNLTYIMDNQFVYLSSAEHINLSRNSIDNIQKYSFSDLRSLKVLDLSYNKLFDDEFLTDLGTLSSLDASFNQFDAFDSTNIKTIDSVSFQGNPFGCSWLLAEIANGDFGNIRLGIDIGNVTNNFEMRAPEEITCTDYDNDDPLRVKSMIRNIVVIRQVIRGPIIDSGISKPDEEDEEGFLAMYPRFVDQLFTGEFNYKTCIVWTILAITFVVILIKLGQYCFKRSERKSEKFRLSKQEKVQKDIEEYFARMNADT